ncbi:bifunctional diguanylate cyclase/phosphodiesterase [Mycoplasmatota bacterium]|nr:bifunctional diguanylate cyclase/phosphodiesterase [Mycoplasmatota bacterium]
MRDPEIRHKTIEKKSLKNTIEIIGIYLVIGISWIFLSDRILQLFITDPAIMDSIQTIKGMFYVIVTAVLFYAIIKTRMDLYEDTITHLTLVVEEVENSNESLRKLESKLYHMAYYDQLTGLSSKNFIKLKVDEHIKNHKNEILGFAYIDIDNIKEINESKGHNAGDELIKLVAEDLKCDFGSPHEIGHVGGDEFILLLKGFKTKKELLHYVEIMSHKIRKTFTIENEEYYVTLSAGVTVYPNDALNYQDIFKNADLALDLAKQHGKNRYVVYSKTYAEQVYHKIEISKQLYYGVKNNEFQVYFQPIVNTKDLKSNSVEALIRWQHPFRGFMNPGEFIEIAEKTSHIREMTWFVIKSSFDQQVKWKESGYDINVSINLSSKVINDLAFVNKLVEMVKTQDCDPSKFTFEITESSIIENFDEAIYILSEIRDLGFKIALDDFGTGYSSLTYLRKLPIDILKIDKSFIKDVTEENNHSPMLKFVIDLAHQLGLKVVCEGAEKAFQVQLLKRLNSDFIQGYYFAKPSKPQDLDEEIFSKS